MEQDNTAEQDNPGFVTSQPADVPGLFRRRAAVVEPEAVDEPAEDPAEEVVETVEEPVVIPEVTEPDKAPETDTAPKV